jgi:hypothetical protein
MKNQNLNKHKTEYNLMIVNYYIFYITRFIAFPIISFVFKKGLECKNKRNLKYLNNVN